MLSDKSRELPHTVEVKGGHSSLAVVSVVLELVAFVEVRVIHRVDLNGRVRPVVVAALLVLLLTHGPDDVGQFVAQAVVRWVIGWVGREMVVTLCCCMTES